MMGGSMMGARGPGAMGQMPYPGMGTMMAPTHVGSTAGAAMLGYLKAGQRRDAKEQAARLRGVEERPPVKPSERFSEALREISVEVTAGDAKHDSIVEPREEAREKLRRSLYGGPEDPTVDAK